MIGINYAEINRLPITKKDRQIICDYLHKKEMEGLKESLKEIHRMESKTPWAIK